MFPRRGGGHDAPACVDPAAADASASASGGGGARYSRERLPGPAASPQKRLALALLASLTDGRLEHTSSIRRRCRVVALVPVETMLRSAREQRCWAAICGL